MQETTFEHSFNTKNKTKNKTRGKKKRNQLPSRVSCIKAKGHRKPSRTLHPGMWTLVQSSSSSRNTPPPPRTHSLPTRQQQRQRNDLKRERNKNLKEKKVEEAKQAVKKREGTDCYLLLMRVFPGYILKTLLLIGFIYMQIYNFSLCKELKDNHSDVIL